MVALVDTSIARAVARAASQMHRATEDEGVLEVLVRSAAEALPTFNHVGVSTVEKDGQIITRASTSALALELDNLQYRLREGPGVASMDGDNLVAAPYIREDARWPNYLPGALTAGLKSQLGVRLHLDDEGILGGLNLYSTTSEAVAPEDVLIASLLATHASLALGKARHVESLNQAIANRQLIGQAIGILMERYGIDAQAAHAYLWRASSHTNVKVRVIAADLVGELDGRVR